MFEKKIEIFKKKDREAWTEIRDLLKKEGVAGISAGHYLQESVMAGGCGAEPSWIPGISAKKERSTEISTISASGQPTQTGSGRS